MKILYIFPHPDDESFGPAGTMFKQQREGHEVYLLVLTRGGATKQRHRYGYSIQEMGDVRYREMLEVEKVLSLTEMTVLDLPDSGLKEMDPREIRDVIREQILRIQPAIVVTYAVHGISGFHDHLVSHAVVKDVYVDLVESHPWLRRLAFLTVSEVDAGKSTHFKLSGSTEDEIDCVVEFEDIDLDANLRSLDCYETFQETIEKSGIRGFVAGKRTLFEIYQENHSPQLDDLTSALN